MQARTERHTNDVQLQQFLSDTSTPIVILLYMHEHGTVNTDHLYNYFATKKVNLVCIHPDDYTTHSLFNHKDRISGIILPGGRNIIQEPEQYESREKFELYLVELAMQYKIPLLGVCRGHQMISHYFGALVADLAEERVKENHRISHTVTVSNQTGSLFYPMFQHKLRSINNGKHGTIRLNTNGDFEFEATCRHRQEVTFPNGIPESISVTMTAADGCIEGLQIGKHIVTVQSHPELYTGQCEARGLFKIFKDMVNEFHRQFTQPELDPRPESTSLTL